MKFSIKLTGISPMIIHYDQLEWESRIEEWKQNRKSKSKAGDDRAPAWKWITYTAFDDTCMAVPSDRLHKCILDAAKQTKIPGAKFSKSFKQDAACCLMIVENHIPIVCHGHTIPRKECEALLKVEDYAVHEAAAVAMGFSLFAKRVRIGSSKHVRVRPFFDSWELSATLDIWDDALERAIPEIMEHAGKRIGLGDWRPSAMAPGPFGRFNCVVHKLEEANAS